MQLSLACTAALIAAANLVSAQSPASTESKTIGGNTITIQLQRSQGERP